MRGFLYSIFFLCLFYGVAEAQVYQPDFDCSRMDPNVPGQVLVCSDSESARSSLILDQAYYALRHQGPAYMLSQFKGELQQQLSRLNFCFPPFSPDEGGDPPHCYRQKMERIAGGIREHLAGRALEEASRPIDEHIALQRRLAALGYLQHSTRLDGVYGESTRRAIQRWQGATGRPVQDGFLGDDDAQTLLPNQPLSLTPAPAPEEVKEKQSAISAGEEKVNALQLENNTSGSSDDAPDSP